MLIFLIFIAIYSSNNVIKNPINKVSNAEIFLTAKRLSPDRSNFKVIYFCVNLYEYMVFDITYLRITLPGKYFKYYSFLFIQILFYKIIYHIIYFLTSYISYVIHIVIYKKPYNIWLFIHLYYNNSNDLRRLYYYDGKWDFNSKFNYQQLFKVLEEKKVLILLLKILMKK